MSFTYNLATLVGQVRLNLPDTNSTSFWFSDEELSCLLVASGNAVYEATARAYEILARDSARAYAKIKDDDVSTERTTPEQFLALAKAARIAGMSGPIQTGTLRSGGNNDLDQYRPLWRTLYDQTLE